MAGPEVPPKHRWAPAAFRDLADRDKLGCVADLHRYLVGMSPRTCEVCRSRWFSPTVDTPYWAESASLAALNAVCMRAPEVGYGPAGPYLCATCRDPEKRDILAPSDNMYIGPSFTEIDALNEIESMLVAIYHPLAQVRTLRPGQTAYVGHVVNLQQKCHRFFSKLPLRRLISLYF